MSIHRQDPVFGHNMAWSAGLAFSKFQSQSFTHEKFNHWLYVLELEHTLFNIEMQPFAAKTYFLQVSATIWFQEQDLSEQSNINLTRRHTGTVSQLSLITFLFLFRPLAISTELILLLYLSCIIWHVPQTTI